MHGDKQWAFFLSLAILVAALWRSDTAPCMTAKTQRPCFYNKEDFSDNSINHKSLSIADEGGSSRVCEAFLQNVLQRPKV